MTSNGVAGKTESNGGPWVKNRCLALCNYSIRRLSVNPPNQTTASVFFFFSLHRVNNRNGCSRTEESCAAILMLLYENMEVYDVLTNGRNNSAH